MTDLGPLVQIVASQISNSKNVTKGTKESVLIKWHSVGNILTGNFSLDNKNRFSLSLLSGLWIKVAVQFHVHLSKIQLATCHHSSVEYLLFTQLLELFLWKRFTSLPVLGEAIDCGLVIAPVFHELRRKLRNGALLTTWKWVLSFHLESFKQEHEDAMH